MTVASSSSPNFTKNRSTRKPSSRALSKNTAANFARPSPQMRTTSLCLLPRSSSPLSQKVSQLPSRRHPSSCCRLEASNRTHSVMSSSVWIWCCCSAAEHFCVEPTASVDSFELEMTVPAVSADEQLSRLPTVERSARIVGSKACSWPVNWKVQARKQRRRRRPSKANDRRE